MTIVQAHPGDVRAAFVVERAAAIVVSHWHARAHSEWNGSAARLLALVLGQRAASQPRSSTLSETTAPRQSLTLQERPSDP